VLLPALALGFLLAITRRQGSRLAGALAEPWLIAGLLVVAAVCGAVGNELFTHGIDGALLVTLGGIVPEVACLAIVGRVIAALLTAEA
jgi:hypothetical protein